MLFSFLLTKPFHQQFHRYDSRVVANNSIKDVQNNQEITGKRGLRGTFPYEKTPLLQNIETGKTVGELVDGNYLIIR
jgi:hypothetical protein